MKNPFRRHKLIPYQMHADLPSFYVVDRWRNRWYNRFFFGWEFAAGRKGVELERRYGCPVGWYLE